MRHRKTLQDQVSRELANRSSERSSVAPLYGISPKYPGKLIRRLPDGEESIGNFVNGIFVPETQRSQ